MKTAITNLISILHDNSNIAVVQYAASQYGVSNFFDHANRADLLTWIDNLEPNTVGDKEMYPRDAMT